MATLLLLALPVGLAVGVRQHLVWVSLLVSQRAFVAFVVRAKLFLLLPALVVLGAWPRLVV